MRGFSCVLEDSVNPTSVTSPPHMPAALHYTLYKQPPKDPRSPSLQASITMAATTKNTQELEKAKKLNHVPWCEEYEKMISGML
jgi:hypothetical protein